MKRLATAVRNQLDFHYFPYDRGLNKHKALFIHIPKTAGTSVLRALGVKRKGRNHMPWYVYRNANPRRFNSYFKFCFVRNPWDRAYSAYRYLINGGNGTHDLELADSVRAFGSFDKFVMDGLAQGMFRSLPLFLPQSNFVLGHNDHLKVDFVGRFENFENDIRQVTGRLHLKSTVPHLNRSMHNNKHSYQEAYHSAEAIEAIEAIYIQDINTFDYAFDKGPNRHV